MPTTALGDQGCSVVYHIIKTKPWSRVKAFEYKLLKLHNSEPRLLDNSRVNMSAIAADIKCYRPKIL